jgi:hypothetical protein
LVEQEAFEALDELIALGDCDNVLLGAMVSA